MKRYLIIFKGQVQGVGFRWRVMEICESLGITGSVKNLDNGNVEAQLQGNSDQIDAFFQKLYKPTGFIRIDDYSMKAIPVKPEETKFRVSY